MCTLRLVIIKPVVPLSLKNARFCKIFLSGFLCSLLEHKSFIKIRLYLKAPWCCLLKSSLREFMNNLLFIFDPYLQKIFFPGIFCARNSQVQLLLQVISGWSYDLKNFIIRQASTQVMVCDISISRDLVLDKCWNFQTVPMWGYPAVGCSESTTQRSRLLAVFLKVVACH